MSGSPSVVDEPAFAVERLIQAPRDRVFQAFLEAEPLRQWFGPDGFDTVTKEIDARLGGLWLFTMHGPDGTDYPNWVRYVEFDPPARIAWDQGQTLGEEPWHRTTVTLEEEAGDATRVTLHMRFPDADSHQRAVKDIGAIEGAHQTLSRLARFLEN